MAQLGYGVAQLGYGVAQLAERRPAVRQARVRIPTRYPREVPTAELASDEEQWRRDLSEC